LAAVATLDKDRLREALAQAVVVIDAEDFERSRRDPRVRELFEGGEALLDESLERDPCPQPPHPAAARSSLLRWLKSPVVA
jgi:hypothetical protein